MFELIYGDVGSGKTLYQTMMLNRYFENGLNVMTNYDLTFDFKKLTDEDIKNYENWEYNGLAIGIDEIHIYCDSRLSGNKRNIVIGYWFTQSRKRNCIIFGTTQFIRQVDLRLRGVVDYITRCTAYKTKPAKKNSKYNRYFDFKNEPCEYCYYFRKNEDTLNCKCLKNKNKKINLVSKACKDFILPDVYVTIDRLHVYSGCLTQKMFYANPYFKLYDTKQVIKKNKRGEKMNFKKYMIFIKINDCWTPIIKGYDEFTPYVTTNENASIFPSYNSAEKYYYHLLALKRKNMLRNEFIFQECRIAEVKIMDLK